MKTRRISTSLALCVLLAACSPAADNAASTPAKTASAAVSGTGSTGIIDCDLYLHRLRTCMAKAATQNERKMIQRGIEQTQKQWAGIQNRDLLAGQCHALMADVRPNPGEPDNCNF